MRTDLKYAWLGVRTHWKQNLLFVLQLAVALIVVNLLVAGLNYQKMQALPYEDFLKNDGFFCWTYRSMAEPEEMPRYETDAIVEELEGTFSTCEMYGASLQVDGQALSCVICDDALLTRMQLPLRAGKQLGNRTGALLSASDLSVAPGDTLTVTCDGTPVSVRISGILTNPTYQPTFNRWDDSQSVSLFYRPFYLETSETPFILMSRSTAEAYGIMQKSWQENGVLLQYSEPPTAEENERNRNTLESYGMVVTGAEMNAETKAALQNAYKKFVPLAVLVFIIALIGFVFHIALQTAANTRRYAVFYLCGMRWRHASRLNACSLGLLLLLALLLSGAFLLVSMRFSFTAQFGLLYGVTNLIATAGMLLISFVAAALSPSFNLRHATPIDIFRRNE